MNKLELISSLVKKADITKAESGQVVNIFFDSMTNALVKGERVEIRGFCSLYVKKYKGYTGRNPKTPSNNAINSPLVCWDFRVGTAPAPMAGVVTK